MKLRRVLIILLCFSSFIFIGCVDKSLELFKTINLDNIDYIKISIGEQFKDITEDNDIKVIVDKLSSFRLEENNNTEIRGYSICIELFNQSEDSIEEIKLIGDNVTINNEWYKLDIMEIDSFENEYLSINYDVKINHRKQKELYERVEKRKDISLIDALKGTWAFENNTYIFFDENYLYQEGYKFKYRIESAYSNVFVVSVFGPSSMFNKDGKLFSMYIHMDDTKTHAKFEKVMTPVLRYKYNMVYVDSEHNKLGSFESDFFGIIKE